MCVNRVGATAIAVAMVLITVPRLACGGPLLYSVTDLGTLGGNQSFALDVNNRGQVSGNARTSSTTLPLLAYLWDAGTMTNLGVIPGSNDFSRAYALNDHGVVVGESDNNQPRAFQWANGAMTDLGTLGGSTAVAHDINNAGQIVGSASNGIASRPFLYDNGQMHDLGTPLGTEDSSARAWGINDRGTVVGTARNATDTASQATLWTDGVGGTVTTLGSLGSGDEFSEALGISDSGWVVGYSLVTGGMEHGFLWRDGLGMLDLGTLGFNHSRATDVNSRGQVVGFASTFANFPSFGGTAFLWDNGTMFDLNQLVAPGAGWTLLSAEGINERGQIVGYGRRGDQLRAYRLTVSEPRSLLLLAIGLLAVARALRRPGHRNDQRGAARNVGQPVHERLAR